jgi:hypothetical protein
MIIRSMNNIYKPKQIHLTTNTPSHSLQSPHVSLKP